VRGGDRLAGRGGGALTLLVDVAAGLLAVGGQRAQRLGAALVHRDGEVLVHQPARGLGLDGGAGQVVGGPLGGAGGLGADLVGLGAGGGQLLGGLLLGLGDPALGLGAAGGQHVGHLVLGHLQHRAHALAHALDALRRADQRTDLGTQPFGAGPCFIQLSGQLHRLVDSGIPIVHQDAHLGVQPTQVPLDLCLLVTLPDHGERCVGRGRAGVWRHATHRTATSWRSLDRRHPLVNMLTRG
jgi:hypothetical protein